jgi:hypothetical protein
MCIINKVTLSFIYVMLNAYAVNPVSLTPMACSRLHDLRSVRHPSFVEYPCLDTYRVPPCTEQCEMRGHRRRGKA